ncbi:L-histidine N(alpha)-methyltransferase [Sphingobium nicotianae]|uniref:L-histidine N(Alpha)-methyltransferase n=1 Tax=Sphingobium nicotianae TaxID=2782607 RepID=A0A9X1DFG0_9SPHN|nr:L-histidine N(alpha)-methyltransferase [Sphingobium nicotianae]MBT2189020.1 L-histidine N(alpha)-methyltransferase [Sphingobium nicotianae]
MSVHADLKLVETDDDGVDLAFRADVLRGLSERQKAIPARWFYDLAGSEIFEEITRLQEYYPTRVETGLLETHGAAMATRIGPNRSVVEFGSGSSVKTPLLLRELNAAAYVPLDISGDFLRQSSQELAEKFPDLPIIPVEANFMRPVELPASVRHLDMLGFFPGSTIGNMVPHTAVDLLRTMRDTLGEGSQLLIGFDRAKDIARLIAAYDDPQGVTARFNLNLIDRINRELDGDMPREKFRHVARWNADWSRIEMHLEALEDLIFSVSDQHVKMRRGETIHTENSHKYTPNQARLLLQAGGWTPVHLWTDTGEDFLIILADATEQRSAP